MKITDDILKALNKGIEVCGSKSAFARKSNVHVASLGKYLSRTTKTIADDTWEKLYPLVKPYLPKDKHSDGDKSKPPLVLDSIKRNYKDISSDEKILLDAFMELSPELQQKKLIELVELARTELKKKREGRL